MSRFAKDQEESSPPILPQSVDRQAEFVALLSRYYRDLHACCLAMGANIHEADDIMQDASVILWQNFNEFQPGTNFLRWGRSVVRNVVRNHRRSRLRMRFEFNPALVDKLFEMQSAAEELLEIRLTALEECLEKLTRTEQQLVRMYYREGTTLADKARERGKSPNTFHKAISRIRIRLSKCIDRKIGMEVEGDRPHR
jgi:RNA polymerase sigma-70 factor (ECF subfamily)